MIPVNQTICNFQTGDCFRACAASILEMPIAQVPNFMENGEEGWSQRIDEFTMATRILLFDIDVSENNNEFLESLYAVFKDVYLIATGKSPRDNSKLHAVVWRNEETVHDPHPDKSGIQGSPTMLTIMVVKDAKKVKKYL